MTNKELINKEPVTIQTEKKPIIITFDDVKQYLCPRANDAEIGLFLKVCRSQNLDPFAREICLVKYDDDEPAAIIIAIESFEKAAENCPEFKGYEAGIVLRQKSGQLEFREGALFTDYEKDQLVGGWAKVYRKDRDKPVYAAVNLSEYRKFTPSGQPTRFWQQMPATMIRNVALRHALKEAFPNRFAGLYATAEFEVREGELPGAYKKNGEPYWKKWWARQKEKGLNDEDVHNILGVTSLKQDWLDAGKTFEEAEDIISKALPLVSRAKKLGLTIPQLEDKLGVTVSSWFAQGRTADEAAKVISEKLAKPGAAAGEEDGFPVDVQWLKESQRALKWPEKTMLSFITQTYKVTGKTVAQALGKLTRGQAQDFTRQINDKLER